MLWRVKHIGALINYACMHNIIHCLVIYNYEISRKFVRTETFNILTVICMKSGFCALDTILHSVNLAYAHDLTVT